MNKKSIFILLVLTPIFFLIAHAVAYLFHEYCHSFMAWAIGYKANPFDLNYGEITFSNIFFQNQVNENVNYEAIAAVKPWLAAVVAFAGIGVGNLLLLVCSIVMLRITLMINFVWRYFFFWLAVMNLGNFIDYIPVRVFASHGDIHEIVANLNISPWWIMLLLGYPILVGVWFFYKKIMPDVYLELEFDYPAKIVLHFFITITLFVFFGAAGLIGYGDIACFMSLLSIYATPLLILGFWPDRRNPEYWMGNFN